ncbi:MAG: Tex family protein [Oscillospiraceae bacterium]
MNITESLAKELNIHLSQVESTIKLIDDGNTIPFIARYRKEVTGSLDDQVLRTLYDRLIYLRNLDEQREKVISSITEQEKMTDELLSSINSATTLTELDDLYRPYRPKRKTRASIARLRGLEPLADVIYEQSPDCGDLILLAAEYINDEVATAEDALNGAMDIIAENVSDDAVIRKLLRTLFFSIGNIEACLTKEDNPGVYKNYAQHSEPIKKIPGHRILALNRGEKEDFLKVSMLIDEEKSLNIIFNHHLKSNSTACEYVKKAIIDAYERLIFPSIEREVRNELTDTASESAIKVFSVNLRQLLMQPPVKCNAALGLDPGYRTGCKVAVVDATGKVLDTGVIYPVPPHNKIEQAKETVYSLIKKHGVEVIAIGNGTASHETEVFASDLIEEKNLDVSYMVVSEAGASVYSASKLAAEEFPQYDVSLRSAVSIARRLQDPLSELVKIDPKAVGVGQYQHDIAQNRLNSALDGVVEDCVNSVGVDLNTASAPLLTRVAGVNATVAKNIVSFREENGEFTARTALKKVPKLGPKAFEQCAGFLKIANSKNFFDSTSVHPESYNAAHELIKLIYPDLKKNQFPPNFDDLEEKSAEIGLDSLAEKLGIGAPTLSDIIKELTRPGRDPRDELPPPMLRKDILDIEHLKPGMEILGTVRNVVDFGAFIDIGVHQDGLVHISAISNTFIRHPSQVLKVGDIVKVWIISIDLASKRIALTMLPPKTE